MAMLEKACKMLADHFIGSVEVIKTDKLDIGNKMLRNYSVDPLGFYSAQSAEVVNACGQEEEMPTSLLSQRADGSTESCLTSQESPGGLTMEGSHVGGKKKMLNLEATAGSVIWSDAVEKRTHGELYGEDIQIKAVKMVLTKEELELLLVKLKNKNNNNGGYRLGELLAEMEKVRSVKVECCWRPSLESIMEDEEDDVISS
ncbi:myb family transcription factor APL-like isoform 2 [Hibiscus syriacus]|uniref:Myb family transcription factor APL-like isoform 2 n=1 Tax=Hibiscus syriacus TaxID=106335 RepID=A0A6A2YLV3_HIBSY|nr:myb family transcription factor APL-like isoform 2 [Hibiscus syriacus]